jgi:hypothetical protein
MSIADILKLAKSKQEAYLVSQNPALQTQQQTTSQALSSLFKQFLSCRMCQIGWALIGIGIVIGVVTYIKKRKQ